MFQPVSLMVKPAHSFSYACHLNMGPNSVKSFSTPRLDFYVRLNIDDLNFRLDVVEFKKHHAPFQMSTKIRKLQKEKKKTTQRAQRTGNDTQKLYHPYFKGCKVKGTTENVWEIVMVGVGATGLQMEKRIQDSCFELSLKPIPVNSGT